MRKHCLSIVSFLLLAACGGSDHNHPLAGNWSQDTGSAQKGITVEFEAGGERCAVHGAPRAEGGHDHPKATYTFDATSKLVTIKGELLGAGKGDTWTGTLGAGALELKSGDTVLKLKAGGASAH